ncbi:MAG: DUF565 domain-containing protein [Synechococcaceae cyanobacterium]|nr:DUF565 domain-containing protein [Synechococcaceae cyanobacterium]
MNGPARQGTRLQRLERRLGGSLLTQLRQSWRAGSLTLLGLLLGYYFAQNLSSLLLIHLHGGRPGAVLAVLLLFELLVRLRSRFVRGTPNLGWVVVDNMRIGATYAFVLEAMKLGS